MAKTGKPIKVKMADLGSSSKKETEVKIVGPTKYPLKDKRTPKEIMDYRENVKRRSK